MIGTEPKEERIRRVYLAFANGNWAVVDSLLADDIVWHEQGRTDVNQRMNVLSYLERDLRPRTVVTALLDVSRAGDRVRSVERSKMERTPGRKDEHRSVSYFRFDDEGNIAEVWHGAEQEPLES